MDEEEQARGAPEVTPPYSAQQDQAQRIEALRTLAQANATRHDAASSPERVRRSPRPPARRMARSRHLWLAVAVLVLASLTSILVYRTHAPAATGLPATLTLDLKAAHAGCPADISWSPDARQLAVMASGSDCIHSGELPGTLLLFDAHSGNLLRSIPVGETFRTQQLSWLGGLAWSPDGTELALPIEHISNDQTYAYQRGVVVVPAQAGQPRVLLDPTFISTVATVNSPPAPALVPDERGGALARRVPLPLAPALSYAWSADGAILPAQPAPQGVTPGTYSGSPTAAAGQSTFAVWQDGVIHTRVDGSEGVSGISAPVERYESDPLLWSPDSRYLLTYAPFDMRLSPVVPAVPLSPADLQSCATDASILAACRAAIAPFPDAALAAVTATAYHAGQVAIAAYTQTQNPQRVGDTYVAWRPDGKLLAAILPGNGPELGNATIHITLYATDTGAAAATLDVPRRTSLESGMSQAWSPTGQQLASADSANAAVTIWGPGALPR